MSVGWLCWGLASQSTIFQSCRDGAIASWVINQYFRGVKCLAQGHNTAEVGLEPRTSRSGVQHSTTEPPRSPKFMSVKIKHILVGNDLLPSKYWAGFAYNSGHCEEISIVWYGGCSQCISWTGNSAKPNWEGSEYFYFKLVGYDGLLKWERFGEFCMYSFWTRWWNVNIVVYGKTMVECNLKGRWQDWPLINCLLSVLKDFDLSWFLFLLCLNSLSAEKYSCSKFVIIRWFIDLNANYWHGVQTVVFVLTVFGGVSGGDIEREWLLLLIILYDREVLRRQIE